MQMLLLNAYEDGSWIYKTMYKIYETFFESLSGVKEILLRANKLGSNGIVGGGAANKLIENGRASIRAIALTIIAVCFLVDLIQNVLLKDDQLRETDIIKALIKLVMAKVVISWTEEILIAMEQTAVVIINNMGDIKGVKLKPENMIENIPHSGGIFVPDWLEDLTYFCTHIIEFSVIILSTYAMKAIGYVRGFELMILKLISPLTMAFIPWSETKEMPKRFLLNYFAVCIQGVVLIAGSAVMIALISSESNSNYTSITMYAIVYMIIIFKSSVLSKQILGIA